MCTRGTADVQTLIIGSRCAHARRQPMCRCGAADVLTLGSRCAHPRQPMCAHAGQPMCTR
eukprot:993418-Pyramimonas_sp.AAC.1